MVKKTKSIIYLLGIILYILGIVSIYYYPKNAHNTYMSENALMPGTARVTFDYSDGLKITQFSNGFQNHLSRYNKQHATLHGNDKQIDKNERSQSCSQWIVDQLKEIGIESYIHKYSIDGSGGSGSGNNSKNTGYNVYSVLRAPKSDGRESIVLSASFNSNDESNVPTPSQVNSGTESSVGVALTILQYLYKKGNIWLAKDLILIISDTLQDGSSNGGISGDTHNNIGLKSWLHDYHDSTIGSGFSNNYFPRAGLIQAAINIETSSKKYQSDHIYVLSEGSNGQLPNLDLINTVGRLAKREGYSKSMLLSPVSGSSGSGSSSKSGSEMIIKYLPDEMKTLARFMFNQAIGIPTGDHGLFNKYHIDAITLGVSGSSSTMGSRVLIGTIRSLNNLLERLHQSFYYYLLPSPFLYISIGEYMISLGLIISPLALGVVYFLISLSNIFTPPTIFTATTTNSSSLTNNNNIVKKKNIFEKLGKFKCLDTPKDIVYSFTIIVIFQLIGVALFSLPQTFTSATENILNYLSTIEIIGLFGSFSVFYILIFTIVSPIIDKMFYPTNEPIQKIIDNSNNNSNNTTTTKTTTTSTTATTVITRNHLKSESNSFFVFSNLPILIFITTMSLLNFSFCTFASILTIPLCFISQICNGGGIGSKVTNYIRKLFVYSFLIIFSPPVLFYLFSHFVLNDQNVFLFLLQIIKQYNQYSSLLFPFLTLIYIPLNLSILKSIK